MTLPSTLGNLNIVFGAIENLAVVSVAILLKWKWSRVSVQVVGTFIVTLSFEIFGSDVC